MNVIIITSKRKEDMEPYLNYEKLCVKNAGINLNKKEIKNDYATDKIR